MNALRKIWLLLILIGISSADTVAQFSIDIYSGLPSNHVYFAKEDRLGYLWITTPKGIVKYNGYQCKNMYRGDVWETYEDKKGRMWLSNFSNEIGYIYHDSYHKVYTPGKNIMYYPISFTDYKDGVYFTSSYENRYLCYERNDTVTLLNVPELLLAQPGVPSTLPQKIAVRIMDGKIIIRSASTLYQAAYTKGKLAIKFLCNDEPASKEIYSFNNPVRGGSWRDYYLAFSARSTAIRTISIKTCRQKMTILSNDKNESLYILRSDDSSALYCVTNKNIYVLDTDLHTKQIYSYKQLLNDSAVNNQICSFFKNDFWGTCISSLRKGIIVNKQANHFSKVVTPVKAPYRYLGSSAGDTYYLWNDGEKKMAEMHAGKYTQRFLPFLRDPKRVIAYDSSTTLILTYDYLYWQDIKGKITEISKNKSYFRSVGKGRLIKDTVDGFRYICVANDKSLFVISRLHGLSHDVFHGDTIIHTVISNNRYNGLTYDKKRNRLFAYNDRNILIYDYSSGKSHLLDQDSLTNLKIKNVNDLLVDSLYGNILIKDEDDIYLYDASRNTCSTLFPNAGLSNSLGMIDGNTLILAGKFGMLFSRITGPGKFSAPVVYYNIKNTNYYEVDNLYTADHKLYLSTDNGLYNVDFPRENEFYKTADTVPYKFIAMYNDTISNIGKGDTLLIRNNNTVVKFDVVNPMGTGTLRFAYSINDRSGELLPVNANEVNLSNLTPGRFYDLSLLASDDVWRSNKLRIKVYIIPQWWQTSFGKKMLLLGGILIALAITFITMFITRRSIVKKNARKNRLLELELKAIYAQINPHFIFNTINSGLLFIKKKDTDEAYRHLFKFSKLLRSYLKSARTRYITLAEEIVNLQDYIELQQSRFEGVFTYSIKLSGTEQADNITIPSLLLQPIVENAINHGLLPMESGGHLNIEFETNEKQLICRIEDNGPGYGKTRSGVESSAPKESYGGDLVKDLVNIFNEYEPMNIKVEYQEKKAPHTGTIVVLTINYYHGKIHKHYNRR